MNNQVPVNKWLITIAVLAGTFMELVDTTVVNVALPHIAGSLSAGVDESTWVLTSYLVSNAIVMPLTAWLSARFGRKRLLMLCLALFTGASMLCGLANSLGELIFFRVFQGAGGGALQPISQAIILEAFPVDERGMAMAVYGIGVIVAPIVGPVMGGWITDNLSWHWAFFINLPVGLVSLLLTRIFIYDPEYIKKQRIGGLDYWGVGLLIVGVGALQVVLDKGQREDWFSSAFITRLSIIAALALIALIYRELKTRHPFVDLRLFKERNYASGVTIFFFYRFVLYGSLVLLPLYLQTLMGYNATLAGEVLAWGGISALILMPIVGRLCSLIDNRILVMIGLLINAVAAYYMSQYNTQISYFAATWPRVLQGIGLAMAFVPLIALTMSRVSQERMGNATGIFNLLRNLGGSFGIAVATTVLSRREQFHQSRLVEHVTALSLPLHEWLHRAGGIFSTHVDPTQLWKTPQVLAGLYQEVVRQAQMLSFCDDYWVFTLLFLVLLPLVFIMRPGPVPEQAEIEEMEAFS
jgi:MFS transporter, DHA2 family, multidrug resistance protein